MNNVSTDIAYYGLNDDVVNQSIRVVRTRSGYRVYHTLTKYHWDFEKEMDDPPETIFDDLYEEPSEEGILDVFGRTCDSWDLDTKEGWDRLFQRENSMKDKKYLLGWKESIVEG